MLKEILQSSFVIFILIFSCTVFSCKEAIVKDKLYNARYKSISQLLKEAKDAGIHLDKKTSRVLIEIISERTSSEVLSLSESEKNEVLRIAITATIDISSFFEAVSNRFSEGKIQADIKNDEELKKELLKTVDTNLNVFALRVLLSDSEYLKTAELDSVLFATAILLSKATSLVGYDITSKSLKDGDSKIVQDLISKTHIEVVLYSYAIISKREDLQKVSFAGARLIDLLPEIKG